MTLVVNLDLSGGAAGRAPPTGGVFAGLPGDFPTLHRSDRAYLGAIVWGGFGVYSDGRPWFGQPARFLERSPIAGRLPGRQPAWMEGYTELGLAGMAQAGDAPLWFYGVATVLTSWSLGQDVFRADARSVIGVEKAYAGALRIAPTTGASLNASVGRQNVTLNDGFLIHFVRGSANAGVRGASYRGPRNANEFSAVADLSLGPWTLKGFYIDPNELPLMNQRSTFAGANLRLATTPNLSADAVSSPCRHPKRR